VADHSSYSPRLRTGLILCGAGTAGAYQAGVLRAIVESGIKIDVLAAHGAGVVNALCAAVDGGPRLWATDGPWTNPRLSGAYRWRPSLRWAAAGLIAMAAVLLLPLVVLIAAAGVYAVSVISALVGLTSVSAATVGVYRRFVEGLFNPPILPTILPRLLVLALLVIVGVLIAAAVDAARRERTRRRVTGAFWWRLLGAPIDASEPAATLVDTLWSLVRGAAGAPRAAVDEVGRRFVDVLADNFGQPGFYEVLVAVHDIDGRRDLVGAVLAAQARAAFESARAGAGPREAEIVDFTGPQRGLVVDFVHGSLALPVAVAPATTEFPRESYWRGERHRLCDRPELACRLVEELAAVGVEQVILVTPAPPPAGPHGMRPTPVDPRGRTGETVRSVETSAIQDAWTAARSRFSGVFVVRPTHNPVGPFDFAGAYDETSDRRWTTRELMEQGYVDAYRQFIEPIVATGERIDVL
jgi:hypothetical protein